MNYLKTINEVHAIEKDFKACGIPPSDYVLVTTQLKIDICEKKKIEIKSFEKKIEVSMKKIHKLIRAKRNKHPYLNEKYLNQP